MHVVQFICKWHVHFIPSFVSRLVATNEKNGASARIKRIQNPVWTSFVLNSKLTHVRIARTSYSGSVWKAKVRSSFLEKPNRCINGLLLGSG